MNIFHAFIAHANEGSAVLHNVLSKRAFFMHVIFLRDFLDFYSMLFEVCMLH